MVNVIASVHILESQKLPLQSMCMSSAPCHWEEKFWRVLVGQFRPRLSDIQGCQGNSLVNIRSNSATDALKKTDVLRRAIRSKIIRKEKAMIIKGSSVL